MQDIIETKPAKVYRHIFVRKRTMYQSTKQKMFHAIMHYELPLILEHTWKFVLKYESDWRACWLSRNQGLGMDFLNVHSLG